MDVPTATLINSTEKQPSASATNYAPYHNSQPAQFGTPFSRPVAPGYSTAAKPPTGVVKVGFYEVEGTIGRGNFAVVKIAKHRVTRTDVAIKIVDKRRLDEENLTKVYREIEVLKKVRHPNIIKLYQVMETSNMIYLVTEYAPQGEIFDLIAKQGRLSENDAREKFWQIISAVDYLHKHNIVHRDLKAENLLLDSSFHIRLADFGFSNYYDKNDTLKTFCGSPPYAAPEVFEGKEYNGPEIDIWSLGVVLYVLVCGVLPFEGANLQLLRDRVLSGRIRIPFFMSSDCENLIRRMLTVDPQKRPTIEQIKKHRWMQIEELGSRFLFDPESAQVEQQEHQQQILKLMQSLGLDMTRIKKSLQDEAYDNFHAIYLLLLERLKASNGAAVMEHRARRRQSDAPVAAPKNRPPLNMLRDHSTFQTTDCITNLPPPPQYAHSDYSENSSTLSRQSTIGTIGSIDEGVEADLNGSSQSRGTFSSSEIVSSNDPISSASISSQFESFDPIIESDIMSSSTSCPPHGDGFDNTRTAGPVNDQNTTGEQLTPDHATSNTNCGINNPTSTPTSNFGDGWRASDNTMFASVTTAFPSGQLGRKTKACNELYRPCSGAVSAQLRKLRISSLAKPVPQTGTHRQTGILTKRMTVPENLEFQPQMLLNIKQSINIEKQISGDNSGLASADSKQAIKSRFQHKRKSRMQLLRQQSNLQMNTKQCSLAGGPTRLHDDPTMPPLSPIEDLKGEDSMDLS